MKKLILICFFIFMGYTVYEYASQLYFDWYYHKLLLEEVPKSASISISPTDGVKADFENDTDWLTVAKLVVSILSTYLGFKLINKYLH